MKQSEKSYFDLPARDVAAIESIIYNIRTNEFCYDEVIEEEPHMNSFGPVTQFTINKEKKKEASVYSPC